jgi:hypothetical protein
MEACSEVELIAPHVVVSGLFCRNVDFEQVQEQYFIISHPTRLTLRYGRSMSSIR